MQARRRKLEETLLSTELLIAGHGIDSPRASWLRGKHRRPQQDCDERRLGHPGTAILLRHRVTNTAVAVSRQQLRRILTRKSRRRSAAEADAPHFDFTTSIGKAVDW